MGDPRACCCVSRSLCGEPDPGSRCAGSGGPRTLSPLGPGLVVGCVSRAQLRGRARWGLMCSCCVRLPWSPPSWLCHLFLPRLFLSSFYFSFLTWSLPGILYLLSCVLTRRPALLPADVHGWAPRLCSRLGHAGRLLPWMGAGGWRLVAGGSAMWVCWGFNTTVL